MKMTDGDYHGMIKNPVSPAGGGAPIYRGGGGIIVNIISKNNYLYFNNQYSILNIRITSGLLLLFILTAVAVQKSFPQSQRELLELAYKNNDYNLLDTFFVRWQKEYSAISKEKFDNLSDVEKDIYNIYYACYKPLDLKSIKWEYEEFSNKGCKYLVLQNSINYKVAKTMNLNSLFDKCVTDAKEKGDTLNLSYMHKLKDRINWKDPFLSLILFSAIEIISNHSIDEFYPYDSYSGLRTVYETEYYKTVLSSFLWNNLYSDYKYPGINETKFSQEELNNINTEFEKRRQFLNKVVRTAERKDCGILYQVGSQKHFSRYPHVHCVYIDEDGLFALAILYFDGDEEILLPLKKANGKWIIDN